MSGTGEISLDEERAQRARLTYIRQELLAPAGAIVGYAELLHEEAVSGKLDDMLADLDRVLEASHDLYSMVDRLLAGEAAQNYFTGLTRKRRSRKCATICAPQSTASRAMGKCCSKIWRILAALTCAKISRNC